jgi:enoyl-CoA hydratase/carnithine racemase
MITTTKTAQINLARLSPAYWRITFDNPPLNVMGPQFVREFRDIMAAIEADEHVRVVVFDSAVEGFFMNHSDFFANFDELKSIPPGPTGLESWPDILVRLTRAPVVSIALIRGRATGNGSELALACDMTFVSREKAVISQWEVGVGMVAGGGPMARLPLLIGRGRALEVLLSSDDIGGELAEAYGYVNRALPDGELDGFVEALATRIGAFDKWAIGKTKSLVNASLPPDVEMAASTSGGRLAFTRRGNGRWMGRLHGLRCAASDTGATQSLHGARFSQARGSGRSSGRVPESNRPLNLRSVPAKGDSSWTCLLSQRRSPTASRPRRRAPQYRLRCASSTRTAMSS